jgi:DNA-binding transcriptional LysR family regulator
MELRHLRAFVAVAEHGNITKAAEALKMAQPPLSRRIQQLEQEVGTRLFTRDGHGARLTPEGRRLLEQARIALAEATHFLELGRVASSESGVVRVGLTAGLLEAVMQLQSYHSARYPATTLECTDMLSDQQNEALRRRQIDVGFLRVVPDCPRVEYETLFLEKFVVLLSRTNPLSLRRTLKLRDLANESVLLHHRHLAATPYDKTLALYEAAGVTPRIISFPAIQMSQSAMMLVALGKAIAFGLEGHFSRAYLPTDEVAVVPLDEPDATLEVRIAWRTGEKSTAVLQLIDSARAVLRDQPATADRRPMPRKVSAVTAKRRVASTR